MSRFPSLYATWAVVSPNRGRTMRWNLSRFSSSGRAGLTRIVARVRWGAYLCVGCSQSNVVTVQ